MNTSTEFNVPVTGLSQAAASSQDRWQRHLNEHRLAVTTAITQIGMREVLMVCRDYGSNKISEMIAKKQRDDSFRRWNGMRNRIQKLIDWSYE
jgi:hypothetical protein